jgi:hypothetical protein
VDNLVDNPVDKPSLWITLPVDNLLRQFSGNPQVRDLGALIYEDQKKPPIYEEQKIFPIYEKKNLLP